MSDKQKKYSSIGRIKKVTNETTGKVTRKVEITQDVVLKQNAVAYINDFVENIDRLVENKVIDVAEGLKRKTDAKQKFTTKAGEQLLIETTHQIMLDLDSNTGNKQTSKNSF
jgi:ABC-type proline/glycine betaine transport system ATPase subunit